jgi:membrane-bound lytic murein transglycosylase F
LKTFLRYGTLNTLIVLGYFCLLLVAISCDDAGHRKKAKRDHQGLVDLDSIRRRGSLIVLTENSASTYFLYRNQESGFDYELALAFAKHLGVRLEVKLIDDVDRMFEMLRNGDADLVASNLTVTPHRSDSVSFTSPLYQTRQVLVQRKIEQPNSSQSLAIQDSTQLGLIPIWVHRYSSFYEQLNDIAVRSGQTIRIEEAPGEISTDDLIRLVDDGAIPATVTDENLATIELSNYDNIDVGVPVSGLQDIAWAVRKESSELLAELNKWLDSKDGAIRTKRLYRKYFNEANLARPKGFVLPKVGPGAISPFDSLFKMYAPQLGWDWRMLASIAYHESHFNPQAQSWSGAYGLMQLMPQTAVRFGCTSTPTPECSVQAATKYIKYLQNMWQKRVPDDTERTKFVLASYNIGQGHIIDAQNLARELGMKDTVWDGNVAEALLLKQQEKYYTMSCVKHGYCNAREPFIFVQKIIGTFELYRSVSGE